MSTDSNATDLGEASLDGLGRVDPQLHPLARMALWTGPLSGGVGEARANGAAGERIPPLPSGLVREEVSIPHKDGAVKGILYRTVQGPARGAVVHMHGGGFLFGSPAGNEHQNRRAAQLGFVVLSVDYSLAPEHQFPVAIEECYAALLWLVKQAGRLNFDSSHIAALGESAGGGLAAALTLLARDRGEVKISYQSLLAPMLDDRTAVRAPWAGTGDFVWTAESNRFAWEAMLGHPPGAETSCYAAPARAENLAGLPSTYLAVGALDLFAHENIGYAERLMASGVETELHVYPGVIHGFELAAAFKATVALEAVEQRLKSLERAFPVVA